MNKKRRTLWLGAALVVILLAGVSLPAGAHPRRARVFFVDPFWYDPFWYYPYGASAYPMYQPAATTGGVELLVSPVAGPKAEVYVNGALAAQFAHKDTLRLAPGEYKVEVRKAGYTSQSRSVYVTAGHTLKLNLELAKAG